eukprot:gene39518-biopygen26411
MERLHIDGWDRWFRLAFIAENASHPLKELVFPLLDLAWTSNCWDNSTSVCSPLMAASATFALKAGQWFRRRRLVMISPVSGI